MENPEYFEFDVSTNFEENFVNIKEEIKAEFPEFLSDPIWNIGLDLGTELQDICVCQF